MRCKRLKYFTGSVWSVLFVLQILFLQLFLLSSTEEENYAFIGLTGKRSLVLLR